LNSFFFAVFDKSRRSSLTMPGTVDESVLDFVELVFEMVRAVDGERTEPEVEGNTALCFGKKN
jgi:hypothetical protein